MSRARVGQLSKNLPVRGGPARGVSTCRWHFVLCCSKFAGVLQTLADLRGALGRAPGLRPGRREGSCQFIWAFVVRHPASRTIGSNADGSTHKHKVTDGRRRRGSSKAREEEVRAGARRRRGRPWRRRRPRAAARRPRRAPPPQRREKKRARIRGVAGPAWTRCARSRSAPRPHHYGAGLHPPRVEPPWGGVRRRRRRGPKASTIEGGGRRGRARERREARTLPTPAGPSRRAIHAGRARRDLPRPPPPGATSEKRRIGARPISGDASVCAKCAPSTCHAPAPPRAGKFMTHHPRPGFSHRSSPQSWSTAATRRGDQTAAQGAPKSSPPYASARPTRPPSAFAHAGSSRQRCRCPLVWPRARRGRPVPLPAGRLPGAPRSRLCQTPRGLRRRVAAASVCQHLWPLAAAGNANAAPL